jgi:hypothetical protein
MCGGNDDLFSSKVLSRRLRRRRPQNLEVGVSADFRKCNLEALPFGPLGSVGRRRYEVFSA